MRVCIINLGCPKNIVDSEVIAGRLVREGIVLTTQPDEADAIIINTCAFISEAVEESDTYIREVIKKKKSGKVKKVLVCGCFPERFKRKLLWIYPEVDGFVGAENPDGVIDALKSSRRRFILSSSGYYSSLPGRILSTTGYAYVKVSEGCSRKCSFCVIPRIRGPYRSRPVESIVEEVYQLVDRGVTEIIFVSQDTTFYGKDIYGQPSLLKLLKEIEKIKELKWVRLLYCYPAYFTRELLEFIRTSEKVVKYLDIPLQHISEKILRRMRRGTSPKFIKKLLQQLRENVPDIFLRTSLIIGFPGEDDKDFEELKRFIQDYPFEYLGVFPYSDERETESFKMKNKVPMEIIKERIEEVMELQREVTKKLLNRRKGKIVEAIVERPHPETDEIYVGRIYGQAPEIDGITYIRGRKIEPGRIIKIKIVSSFDYDLEGVTVGS